MSVNRTLPRSLTVGGTVYDIRPGYGAVLDIITALSDTELTNYERANVSLRIFYKDIIPDDVEDAIAQMLGFIQRFKPETSAKRRQRLMDWEQDFDLIADAITVKSCFDIRADEDMHWWTFLAYYQNIGDCFFAQVVSIRNKLQRGKKLDDMEREFYRNNRDTIDLKIKTTPEEDEVLAAWLGLGGKAHGG